MKVLYHDNCADGFAAAWVAHKAHPTADFKAVSYGQRVPWEWLQKDGYPSVLIVDFSYSRAEILELREVADVAVIDHHKTAEKELSGLEGCIFCIFDMTKSGCVLTWEYFHEDKPVPKLLQYIQDRDLWKFELPDSKEINAYIGIEEHTFEAFHKLAEELESDGTRAGAALLGRTILRSQKIRYELAADQAILRDFAGHRVPVVNCSLDDTSGVLHLLISDERFGTHFAVSYCDRADGKRQWGLRGHGEIDVAEIAKRYGGGGHHNSAGFVTDARNPLFEFQIR